MSLTSYQAAPPRDQGAEILVSVSPLRNIFLKDYFPAAI
jgi:hypothetical protein